MAWVPARERARIRADISNAMPKDIRARHATDAERAGHTVEDIGAGLAHADVNMTRVYLKEKIARRGKVDLKLPSDDRF
jgi:integrase